MNLAPAPAYRPATLEYRYYALALCGAALIVLGGAIYRTDQVRCSSWPPVSTGLLYGLVYLVALALLGVAWLGLAQLCAGRTLRSTDDAPTLPLDQLPTARRILCFGLLLNLCGLLVPPFLGDDALAYAAVGRAMWRYHQNMYTPLGQALPTTDLFRQMISHQDAWLQVGSAYSPAFNWLTYAVSSVAGDDLTLHLRLFQLIGFVATLITTLLVGQAAKEWALQQSRPGELLAGATATTTPVGSGVENEKNGPATGFALPKTWAETESPARVEETSLPYQAQARW